MDGTHKSGVALRAHDGFDPGDLYRIPGTRDEINGLIGPIEPARVQLPATLVLCSPAVPVS
jgi:hypothetical protein